MWLTRSIVPWLALGLGLALASVAPAGSALAANGLIVRLKSAPAHEHMRHNPPEAQREQARWRGVLRAAALTGASGVREPLLHPTGRDQQWLDCQRRLGPEEAQRLAARLRLRPEVAWVEANTREQRQQTPGDPLYTQQFWLQAAGGSNSSALASRLRGVPGFQRAWATGLAGATGSSSAIVAVLDTGITAHPELAGRTLPGYDFVSQAVFGNDGDGRDADPADPGDWVSSADLADPNFSGCRVEDSSWHGTLIAGLVAAATDNGQGVAAINHQGRVLPVRVAGKCGADLADIVDGMRWAAGLPVAGAPVNANPARIINISFGGSAACGPAYQAAVDELKALAGGGAVVLAAAGNEWGAVSRPANCTGVVGVAALNRDGFKTNYSNFGSALAATGLATVGGDDDDGAWGRFLADSGLTTVWNSGTTRPGAAEYASLFGTSFAAPLAAGTASLMLSVNPALTADQIISGLYRSVRPHVTSPRIGVCSDSNPGRCICTTATCGAGILDAEQALRFAADPSGWVAPVRSAEVVDNPEVAAATALGPDRPPNAGSGGGGSTDGSSGGGAVGALWLWLLALACVALRPRALQ